MYDKENLKKESQDLIPCPFCGGNAEFVFIEKSKWLMIRHLPKSGVNCPARFEQICDTFEMGKNWWNTRS